MDILYLIDRLDNLIASSRRMPLINQIMLKEGDILSIVDQMRTSIPEEVKQARRVMQEKERILAQAQEEASSVLARAREETERAMQREGLLHAAEERSQELIQQAARRSEELVHQAEEEAERLKDDADAYVVETLRAIREHLLGVETEIGRTIMSVERGLDTMENTPSEDMQSEEMDAEMVEEDVETRRASQHSVPRRASLAIDTMGGPSY
ncbi:MAG TPA: hypothetical protein VH593_10025 [Ktedonobacteraceae bacterium]|jgi:hypothetical protein